MNKDHFFQEELSAVPDFTFSNAVASVFDDMVSRSVPYSSCSAGLLFVDQVFEEVWSLER